MQTGQVYQILNLCLTPRPTMFFYPLLSLVIFLSAYEVKCPLEPSNLYPLMWGISVALISNFGANLWNHSNDIKEDLAHGKNNILTQGYIDKKTTIFLALIFYIISISIIYAISIKFNRPILIFFLIWCFITWWYSDTLLLKKIFGFRLKDHYIGELVTYSIACPSFTLSLWLVYSDLNFKGLALTLVFIFYGISGLLIKDLKDIYGDREAGLMTFGVVFQPSFLLYLSSILLVLYYISIFVFTAINVFDTGSFLVVIPFLFFIMGTFVHFYRKNWKLEKTDYKSVQNMMLTTYASLFLLAIGNAI
ncbi:MAG: UbiA family prenyltransferase [Halobacteriota archaeon]|nr:UbiA family prenyltransferase [Halobacteriota archaeon]